MKYFWMMFCSHDWRWVISKTGKESGIRIGIVECIKCGKSKEIVAEIREAVEDER
jgi:hypothetical protein